MPATTTTASTRFATSTPEENTSDTVFCARTIAFRVAPIRSSTFLCTRRCTPYARMVSAPTTASDTAPSMAPTRSRTVV